MPRLVLASTSPFRRELLARLGLPFETAAPSVDESPRPGERADQLVLRLAEAKARAVADAYPEALIIGSDQVAELGAAEPGGADPGGAVLGKPGNRERAIGQLTRASGRTLVLRTGLCLLRAADGHARSHCELFKVHFRSLTRAQIEAYVDRERPFGCAGSFKSEGLGIALFDRLEGADPNALIGLPLIRLVDMLAAEGVDVLTAPRA